jgi:hypothetical protein
MGLAVVTVRHRATALLTPAGGLALIAAVLASLRAVARAEVAISSWLMAKVTKLRRQDSFSDDAWSTAEPATSTGS